MRVSAYATVPAAVFVAFAALACLLAPAPQFAAAEARRDSLPPVPGGRRLTAAPGSPSLRAAPSTPDTPSVLDTAGDAGSAGEGRGFDRPYRGFAPAGTVLRRVPPGTAGLDPAPIDAFLRRLTAWTRPSRGADYLFPGATALMAHDGAVVARRATGDAVRYAGAGRQLPPGRRVPARTGTVYDLASLSKLFTSIVAAQQIQAGRLRLDATAAHYLPAYAAGGKGHITIRQLLTHTSGLPSDPKPPLWQDPPGLRARERAILRTRPSAPPGSRYLYSDLNMLSMQLVLEKVTGRRLDALVRDGITGPLRMRHTAYRPPASWRPRIAATADERWAGRGMLRGSVHDSNAWALGGVAGHAGVFSTVDDLSVLAQSLLNGGTYRGRRILRPHTVSLMERNYNRRFPRDAHGLGFELNQPWYMGGLTSPRTLGHTGFTGTSLVIDPESRSFAILLTNRVHPDDQTPSTNPARRAIAQALARSIPVQAPGEGRSWFGDRAAGPARPGGPGAFGGTLTTGPLRGSGPLDVTYDAFLDAGTADRLVLEWSADAGRTWRPVPRTGLAGSQGRAWRSVRARVPSSGAAGRISHGVRLRWAYALSPVSGGRGVNLAGMRVTDGTRVLFDADCAGAPLTAAGWHPSPRRWPLVPAGPLRCGPAGS